MEKLWRKEGKHCKVKSKLFTIWHQQRKSLLRKYFELSLKSLAIADGGIFNIIFCTASSATFSSSSFVFVIRIYSGRKRRKKCLRFLSHATLFSVFFRSHLKVHSVFHELQKLRHIEYWTAMTNFFRECTYVFDCDESLIASSDRRTLLHLECFIVWFVGIIYFSLRAS